MPRIRKLTRKALSTYPRATVERLRRFGEVTKNGVVFDYDLINGGAMFGLLREKHHTDEDIEAAAQELARDRDVIGRIAVYEVIED